MCGKPYNSDICSLYDVFILDIYFNYFYLWNILIFNNFHTKTIELFFLNYSKQYAVLFKSWYNTKMKIQLNNLYKT